MKIRWNTVPFYKQKQLWTSSTRLLAFIFKEKVRCDYGSERVKITDKKFMTNCQLAIDLRNFIFLCYKQSENTIEYPYCCSICMLSCLELLRVSSHISTNKVPLYFSRNFSTNKKAVLQQELEMLGL